MFRKTFNFLIVFIICIVPLIITPWRLDYYYLPKARVLYLVSAFLLLLLLFSLKKWIVNCESQDLFVLLYLTFVIFSTIASVNPDQSIYGRILRHEGLLALASYIIIFIAASKYYSFRESHIYLFVYSLILISLYAVAQYFGFDPVPVDSIREGWSRFAYSTLGNPNFLGSFLTLALPLISSLYIFTRKNFYLLISGLAYLALLCTRTRGAWIGASISFLILVVFFLVKRINLRPFLNLAVCFVVLTIMLNLINNFETQARFTSIIKDAKTVAEKAPNYEQAGSTRVFIWEKSLELIKTRPLTGYGPDTFDIPFMENFREEAQKYFGSMIVDKAHNEYLQIAVTIGLPGLACYLLFIFTITGKAIKSLRKNPAIIVLLASLAGYWIQAFFNISVVSVAPVYWAFMGIMASQFHKENTSSL